jgi:methyl-accepting chemotaxis protein
MQLSRLFHFTLRQKLILGFGIIVLLVAAIVASGIVITGGMSGSLEMIRDEAFPQALVSLDIENSINLIVLGIEASTESGAQTFIDDAGRVLQSLNSRIEDFKVFMEGKDVILESLDTLNMEVQSFFKTGEELYLASHYIKSDRVPSLKELFHARKKELLAQVASLKEDGVLKLEEAISDISERGIGTGRLALILGVIAVVLGILVVIILSLSIMKPMNRLLELMKKAEHGDFTVRYPNNRLVQCWEELHCEKENCPAHGIEDLRCWQIAGTLCDHGFTDGSIEKEEACEACRVYQKASADEFSAIGEAFNNMMVGFVNLLRLISRASTDVMSASKNLFTLSEELRLGSDQQYRSVDEVTSSIEEMNNTIKDMAESAKSYCTSAEESNTSLLEMTAAVEEVAHSAELLTGFVQQTGSLLDDMTASIREAAQHSGSLSQQVEQSSTALLQIETSVKEVVEGTKHSSELASLVTKKLMKEGSTAVDRAADSIVEIRNIVTGAADVMCELTQRSSDIGKILEVIEEVSDQTRLLSLNAAILAAQSGEQGRAFSVVAEEIRALSDRTSASTQEIKQLLSSMPGQIGNVTEAIQRGTVKVDEGVRLIDEMKETINVVSDAARKSAEASRTIMAATDEQASSVRQAVELEQNIAAMSREITDAMKFQSENCGQIISSADQMKELATIVKRATEEQSKGTKLISHTSSESIKVARKITEATREEAKSSELILKSIDSVSTATVRNMEVFARMSEMVASLKKTA